MSTETSEQVKLDPFSEEAHERRLADLDKAELPADTNYMLLWDTLSHCAEPGDSHIVLEKLEATSTRLEIEKKEKEAADKEHADGQYRVKFDGRSFPERHPTWPADFQLHIEEGKEYFYVVQSGDIKPQDDDAVYNTDFAPGDSKTRLGEFGYKYACGSKARDANNNLVGKQNDQIEFNYAEHKMMGEMLTIKWSNSETTRGTRELNLPNGVKLSYGEINGLGGDFFGSYHPVSSGKDFAQRCQYFMDAFDTLGKSGKAVNEVAELRDNRRQEVEAIAKAVENGQSTFQVYKGLKKDGNIPGLSAEDEQISLITMKGEGPSYLRLAQINLDHFGNDAKLAYNAGHYCALKKAAEGDLETAYAMNAFADHYLGDCFASGHYRTPRRVLHGSETAFHAGWAAISGMVQQAGTFHLNFLQGAMKVMAPDLCAMLMHNEDNKLGITVKNKRGDEFTCWGDKQMFEPQNKRNLEIMRQGMQASVDEVYEAFVSKTAKTPEQGYRPWDYAPNEVIASKTHSPLFITYEPSWYQYWKWGVKVRTPFEDPNSTRYEEVGGSPSLIDLYNKISTSEQWKKY